MARVRIDMHDAEIAELLYGPGGPVVRHVAQITRRTRAIATATCPVDDGVLRASIDSRVTANPGAGNVTGEVGTRVEYAVFVHQGTGLFGPQRRRITPVRASVLSWQPRTGPRVFARSVRGAEGQPWLAEALETASPYPVVALPQGVYPPLS